MDTPLRTVKTNIVQSIRAFRVPDLQATILHCLGIDHERLTVRHGGLDRRLTDVHGDVVREVLA